jgi:hypothetical protein
MYNTKYKKFVDDNGEFHYQLELESGNKHMVKKELGDYLHQLEQKLNT